jgi:hypothetical protein
MKRSTALVISTTALALMGTTALGTGPALAHDKADGTNKRVSLSATLTELNGSGASGTATAVVKNQKIESISVHAHGLTPDAPHAQHIHYGEEARNECPSLFDDTDGDGLINTVEGVPAYGPVVVSLTTTGDTTPASTLAVDRYPVSQGGSYDYFRTGIEFTDVAGTGYSRWRRHRQADRRLDPRGRGRRRHPRRRLQRQRRVRLRGRRQRAGREPAPRGHRPGGLRPPELTEVDPRSPADPRTADGPPRSPGWAVGLCPRPARIPVPGVGPPPVTSE